MRLTARKPRFTGGLAVDLGTARTRVLQPTSSRRGPAGVMLDEPTVVARRGRTVLAAGRQAWRLGTATSARLSWPVRHGVVVDPVACVQLLRELLPPRTGTTAAGVVLAVRADDSVYDTAVLTAVAASAIGVEVRRVDTLLAAAIGAGLPVDEPAAGLVCDVGAGVLELGAVGDGRLLASATARLGTRDYLDDPPRVRAAARGMLRHVLRLVPATVGGDLAAQSVCLVGGGALVDGLSRDLAQAWRTEVQLPDEPRLTVVRGLAACLRLDETVK